LFRILWSTAVATSFSIDVIVMDPSLKMQESFSRHPGKEGSLGSVSVHWRYLATMSFCRSDSCPRPKLSM